MRWLQQRYEELKYIVEAEGIVLVFAVTQHYYYSQHMSCAHRIQHLAVQLYSADDKWKSRARGDY